MVCLGNICRSPLAEGILQHKAAEKGISMDVDSAGTSGWHIGEGPDKRSVAKANEYGIDISQQQSRQFEKADFNRFDIIYAMDSSNYNDIVNMADREDDKAKVQIILNESNPGSNQAVPDPYYGGDDGFETVYQLLDYACDKIIEKQS